MKVIAQGSMSDILKSIGKPLPGSAGLHQVLVKDPAPKSYAGAGFSSTALASLSPPPGLRAASCARLRGRSVIVNGKPFTFDDDGICFGAGGEFDVLLGMNGIREVLRAPEQAIEPKDKAIEPVLGEAAPSLPPEPAQPPEQKAEAVPEEPAPEPQKTAEAPAEEKPKLDLPLFGRKKIKPERRAEAKPAEGGDAEAAGKEAEVSDGTE